MTPKNPIPYINQALCIRCGNCVKGCPETALLMTSEGPAFVQPVLCTYCTACESLCPTGAIRAPYRVMWDTNG